MVLGFLVKFRQHTLGGALSHPGGGHQGVSASDEVVDSFLTLLIQPVDKAGVLHPVTVIVNPHLVFQSKAKLTYRSAEVPITRLQKVSHSDQIQTKFAVPVGLASVWSVATATGIVRDDTTLLLDEFAEGNDVLAVHIGGRAHADVVENHSVVLREADIATRLTGWIIHDAYEQVLERHGGAMVPDFVHQLPHGNRDAVAFEKSLFDGLTVLLVVHLLCGPEDVVRCFTLSLLYSRMVGWGQELPKRLVVDECHFL